MDFCGLPEGCISHAISFTSPRDACRSSAASATFRSASESDAVWERFLPRDYADILARAVSPLRFSSRKELYFRLCQPLLLDQGKTSFWLEKSSGKKCYMVPARELAIVWGDTEMYWRWITLPESRFPEVAELLNVCWLDIKGKFNTRMLSPKTTYVAYLVLKTHPDAFGLGMTPAELSVKLGDRTSTNSAHLQSHNAQSRRTWEAVSRLRRWRGIQPSVTSMVDGQVPQTRGDGWLEVEVGEFYNDDGEDGEVEMSVTEIRGGHWKRGLIIEGIEIRPKSEPERDSQ